MTCSDLNGAICAEEELLDVVIGVEIRKMLGYEAGVVEGTSADMAARGGEGDNRDWLVEGWYGFV